MLHRLAGAMGWKPGDMAAASMWQLTEAWAGWCLANGVKQKLKPPKTTDFDNADWDRF